MIYLLLALATWRAAAMLVKEDGPFMLFYRLRVRAGLMYDQNHEMILLVPDTFFAQLLSCMWCATIWTGGAWTLLYFFIPDIVIFISLPFALSAAAIGWERMVERLIHNGV